MRRPVRIGLYVAGALATLILLVAAAIFLILPTQWFEDKVRARIVSEIERASGGRAEIGSFDFDWKNMKARVAPFVLHGAEPPGEQPLFRASSIELGLKIISIVKRDIDIASLTVRGPQVNLIVDEKGITNFPRPKVQRTSEKDPIQALLDLAVGEFVVVGGSMRYRDRKIPLELHGRNLEARFSYDFSGPRYIGTLNMERVYFDSGETKPMEFSFESRVKLARDLLEVDSARMAMPRSNIALAGRVSSFSDPRAEFEVRAVGDLRELGPPLQLPATHAGTVAFTGTATYTSGETYQLAGKVSGRGLTVNQGTFRLANVALDSDLRLNKDQLILRGLNLKALGGTLTGAMSLTNDFRSLKVNGQIAGVSVRSAASAYGVRNLAWNGSVSGPIEITGTLGRGSRDLKVAGRVAVTPARGQAPVDGRIEFAWDARSESLQLGRSYLNTPQSRLEFTGTLGQRLDVHLETRDINDLLPVIAIASPGNVPQSLPVRINQGGMAVFDGTVVGPVRQARISGSLKGSNLVVQSQPVDTLLAQVEADPSGVRLRSVAAGQGQMKLEGNFDIALDDWRFRGATPVAGKLRLEGASLKDLLARQGQNLPIDGTLFLDMDLTGTGADPNAVIRVRIEKPVVYGEQFDRITAEVRYAGTGVEIINGVAEAGSARILMAGAYVHPPTDWKNGQLKFDLTTQGFTLAQINTVQRTRPGVTGLVDVKAVGRADVRNMSFLLTTLDGRVSLRDLVVQGRPVGDFVIDAKTAGQQLSVAMNGNFRGSKVAGTGTFELAGDYNGRGEVTFSPLAFSTIQDLLLAARPGSPLPVEGVVEGRATFSGPVRRPELMTARLELPTFQIVPTRRTRAGEKVDLALRNEGPIVLVMDPKGVHVESARLVGPDTNFELAGTLNWQARNPWDLKLVGTVNLAIIENFNPDFVASGATVVNATIRGSLQQPQIVGRMELKNASFYATDFPNGIDQANGVILFDRNRATVERLTAVTGGGKLTASGFVGYGTGDITYRLQARADGVRVRYPEGVSTTANAALNLNGTRARGILSGVVTVLRAGFNPRTDVGGLLAASAKPVQTPATPNEFLRSIQLDLRVETVPNLTFQTNLTQDLQAEADLRVRGTAAKPVVLGRITVNQGEIQFFGNKYTINRGEIGFYNPVRIEPTLDMDLETRVRGVIVNINFAGPVNKLNVSYRSDPPLQSTEIVALLAVGRAPGETTGIASGQTVTNQSFLQTGTNSLLGQAVAAPVSSRLQRFFGVSRLKIDPNLQNLDAVPQARLTIEQQISRDITLTYITNLADTNQQIVRFQWDLNRNWSLIAVREENGLFGVDFLYRKRIR